MERNLIIIRGVPGCGKTTFAEMIATTIVSMDEYSHTIKFPVFTADDYHMKNGKYDWKQENQGKAHAWCQEQTRNAMQEGLAKICVANTSTTERELKPYQDLAGNFGYKVHSVIIENRHDGVNVHAVPDATLEKMEIRFQIKLI